ncbi:C2 calcium-dependent domain-containing protein 4A [Brienomyrus brachyistius]|uniref:C2 calcium-dependent domain-containing protein 4A n=1 Tax=Brienomyrus brachyistius TaxID=42636 RepID=UPI0020B2E79A|nr:C2 calcium-dependent domain-containing protein 4A [Brienomyrus brachyistius]
MWMLEKIRVSVERTNLSLSVAEYSFKLGDGMFGERPSHEKGKKIPLCPNVITPDTIPEFCIPPKISPQHEGRGGETVKPGYGLKCKAPRDLPMKDAFSSHIIQVEAADEATLDDGYSDEDSTNADPQSQAALSLPHLPKTHTCYGFCTLLESPHTRRKESLFHSDPAIYSLPFTPPTHRSPVKLLTTGSLARLGGLTSKLSPRGLMLGRQGTLDSDTTSSAESSPFSSPLLVRPLPRGSLFKALSCEKLACRGPRRTAAFRNDSLSTDEGSSTDNSPNVLRRASEGPVNQSFSLAPPVIFPTELELYRDRVLRESRVPLGRDGALRLSAEYCTENRRFRVRLISAEGLYTPSVDPRGISCTVSLSLLPGRVQKQRSTVIRKSRNPIFNEDFFFDGVSEDDLYNRSLRFKVINKMSSMKRDYTLGHCEIPLSSIVTL